MQPGNAVPPLSRIVLQGFYAKVNEIKAYSVLMFIGQGHREQSMTDIIGQEEGMEGGDWLWSPTKQTPYKPAITSLFSFFSSLVTFLEGQIVFLIFDWLLNSSIRDSNTISCLMILKGLKDNLSKLFQV